METPNPQDDLNFIGKIARRMCIIIFGYAAAVASAAVITLLVAPTYLFSGAVLFGMFITAITAAPAMLCFVAFSEIRYRVGPGGHILAGTLTALAAHAIFPMFVFGGSSELEGANILGFSTLGGAAGGWVYWRIAVAHLQDAVTTCYDSMRLTLPAQ